MRNNRIIRTTENDEVYYGVSEVFYNEEDDNKPCLMTEFLNGTFSSIDELREHYAMILEDIDKCIALDAILPEYTQDNSDGIWSKKPLYDEDENEWISADECLKELNQLTQPEE